MAAIEKNIQLAKNEIHQLNIEDTEKVNILKELDKEWINYGFCGYSSEEEEEPKQVVIKATSALEGKDRKYKEAKQEKKQEAKQEEKQEDISDEEKDIIDEPIEVKSEYTTEDIIIDLAYKKAKEERSKNDVIKELEAFSEKERLEREQQKTTEVKQINTSKYNIKKPSKIEKEDAPIPELIITELEPIKISTSTPASVSTPALIPISTYVDSVFADSQRQKSKEDKMESTLKRDLRRATDTNADLQKEIKVLKEENNKLKLKETSQADEIAELKKLLSEQQKYKIYYDKMHLNADNFQEFINRFYISSDSRSNRIKCSIIYDKYISETKKAISKQTFYDRIENLGFPKVIVNGERCFSNILSKL